MLSDRLRGVASLVTDIYSVTAMGLCNRCSVTVPNAQPRNAVPERSERLPKLGTDNLVVYPVASFFLGGGLLHAWEGMDCSLGQKTCAYLFSRTAWSQRKLRVAVHSPQCEECTAMLSFSWFPAVREKRYAQDCAHAKGSFRRM